MRLSHLSLALLLCTPQIVASESSQEEPKTQELQWLDPSIKPSDDFFAYANGGWQKQHPIPADYSSWGTFSVTEKATEERVYELLKNLSEDKEAKPGSLKQKLGDFFFSGMDVASLNKLGASPLEAEFTKIKALNKIEDLSELLAHLQEIGLSVIFSFDSMQDFQDSNKMIGVASQGGLSLPDRDYYLKDEASFKKIRQAYLNYIKNTFVLLGDSSEQAANKAKTVLRIETLLAKASMSKIMQRNPHAIYHIKTLKELEQSSPNFSWQRYFSALGLNSMQSINLAMPDFFQQLNTYLKTIPLDDWKVYLQWHLIAEFSPYLSDAFVNESFKMQKSLVGTEKLQPRWQRVVDTANSLLGFAIGKLYVKRYFSPQAKEAVLEIFQNIRNYLATDLENLSWMTPETRQAALKKLSLIQARIAYPDKWRDYSSLKIDRGPYALNIMRCNQFLAHYQLNKIGKPVDKNEWAMPPQEVNAYYDPSMNNINIPAGILQPPFFDPKAPAAANYGGIGFVIGHELTHGFDDEGAQFDGHGNLKNWWSKDDLKKFHAATQCIVNQFSHYQVAPNFPVQGKLVSGEATADLGGLILAYHAFKAAYPQPENINGQGNFSPEQEFFLSSAHIWASNIRLEKAKNAVTTDPHPPARFRVNGTLANLPEFQEAFSIKPPSLMINAKPCKIW